MSAETVRARLLVVDDDAGIRESLVERFAARGFSVSSAASGEQALERARRGVDVVLLDLALPRGDGMQVLAALRAEGCEAPVIVITAHGSVKRAVEAMRAGAYDFLEKPFEAALVEETVRRALERRWLVSANRALRERAEIDVVHGGEPMASVLALARKAAASAATVLIRGPSGSGKEVVARAIHRWSARAAGPFVELNCAALAEGLLESELFGHEKGAFTGAHARREGRLEAAHGGTLFLDEIGDTGPGFQVKLLRVLQERSFQRVGGNESIEVDIRVVAATHRDLAARVREGSFREDLYWRLEVISLNVPPLCERRVDVAPLARHFLAAISRELSRPRLELSAEAIEVLEAQAWPGNVRQLRNAIERAAVLADGDRIEAGDFELDLPASASAEGGFHARVEEYRREVLRKALEAADGNQTRAAQALGLQRTYLARLIRKYGL